jgi:formamidopyrimidine-DNA glycosylase
MPELPEVETLKRELGRVLVGKKIKAFSAEKFVLDLVGKKIEAVERRAKIIVITLSSGQFLLVHLKMTGQLIFKPAKGKLIMGGHPEDPTKYTRATFDFTDNSQLLFNDLRKFGWLKLVTSSEAAKILDVHGVEPLSRQFTLTKFKEILARYPKRKIKQLLLDQTLIAGLGNIYVDEACFGAYIFPTRLVASLKEKEISDLHAAIIAVLKLSISKKGTSARNYRRSTGEKGGMVALLKVYGRAKLPCKRCTGTIQKIKLNGRGTHFCNQCQK